MKKNFDRARSLAPRRHLSQNFIRHSQYIDAIIDALSPGEKDLFIEIGPGKGALTVQLFPVCAQIVAIEIDQRLVAHLNERFARATNVTIIHHDALEYDFSSYRNTRLTSNLPYHISTPLLLHFLAFRSAFADMHLMFQKEVAQRICAQHRRSRLAFVAQLHCRCDYLFDVPASAFFPQPRVDSAVIRLQPRSRLPLSSELLPLYERIVKRCFLRRRKTLSSNLQGVVSRQQLDTLGIDPGRRAETLGVEEMVRLTHFVAGAETHCL